VRVAVRGGALGDILLGIPTWRAIRDAAPETPFVIGVPSAVRSLVRAALHDEDCHQAAVTALDDPAIAWVLGGGPVRTSVAVPDWMSVELAVAWTRMHPEVVQRLQDAGVQRVVGADPFPPPGTAVHAADWLEASLDGVGIAVRDGWDAVPWLRVPEVSDSSLPRRSATPTQATGGCDRGVAGAYAKDDGISPLRHAVVHPGSGSPHKWWPANHWRAVIEALVADEWSVTILEGEADGAAVGAVLGGSAVPMPWTRAVTVMRGAGTSSVAATLAEASIVVANDSGIAHLAAGLGAPVVVVFGPTDPRVWRPRGPRVVVVGGTLGATWPHASRVPPDSSTPWPTVGEVLGAVDTVVR
jgi:hypothetical protein